MDKKIIKLLKKIQENYYEFIHIRIYSNESGGFYMGNGSIESFLVFEFEDKKELKKRLKKYLKETIKEVS